MTIAYWCVLIAALLPYPFTVLAKSGKGFNNHTPRLYLEKLQDWRRRAHWVQLNSFEIFPFFAAAVIIAHRAFAPQTTIDSLAIIFIISRILYGICYITDKSTLRTLVWTIGFLCCIGFFVI